MSENKVFPDDEGPLTAVCYIKGDQVVIEFGKSLSWLSLDKASAQEFIATLQEKVDRL